MKTNALVVILALGQVTAAQAAPQHIVIPAFFGLDKKTDGVHYDWMRILQAGSAVKIVVAGLDSIGTGTGPNTGPTSNPTTMFDALRANHTLVLGYVMTRSASRDLLNCPQSGPSARPNCNVVENSDVATRPGDFSVNQWYTQYGGHIDGIFFDVGPSAEPAAVALVSIAAQQAYYQALYTTVRNAHPMATGGCAGFACIMLNAAQFPGDMAGGISGDWVVNAASDFATMYERQVHGSVNFDCPTTLPDGGVLPTDQQDYLTTFCPSGSAAPANCVQQQFADNWYFTPANTAKIAHILSSASASDMNAVIARGRSTYGTPALLYIYDGGCDPNKPNNGTSYNHLSSLFEQTVAALDDGDLQIIYVSDPAGKRVPVVLNY